MHLLSSDLNLKALVRIAAIGLTFAIAGCASTGTPSGKSQPAPAPAPAARPAPTPAPASVPIAAPSGDRGTVVFFRASKFAGAAVSFKVREGDVELGKLSSGNYFVVQAPAGPHAYTVHSEAKDVLNLEVERGETYYVQGSISMGFLVGRPNLAPSDAATFNGMKGELKDSAAAKK